MNSGAFQWTVVMSACEPSDMGTESQTWVLCKTTVSLLATVTSPQPLKRHLKRETSLERSIKSQDKDREKSQVERA